jgi:O-antigen/teichoic acid export membrane protein
VTPVQASHARASVPGRGTVLGVLGRLGWGVADQAVSSLGNFAIGLYVARTFGAAAFGAFALAFVTYTVVLNAARGMSTDPLLVRYSGAQGEVWRGAAASATGTSLVAGTVAGLISVVVGLLVPAPVGPAFVALGAGLPGLMLQDSWRFCFFAGRRGASALINDVVWGLLLVGALVVMHRTGSQSMPRSLLAFGGTALAAALVGVAQGRVLPRPRRAPAWLREQRQLASRYLVENVSASGASQLRSTVLGAVAGLAPVGYVRGAEILMGPFAVVLMGVSQVAVPEASRVFHRTSRRLGLFCLTVGGVQAVAALAWGVGLYLALPYGPGELLLGTLWKPASQLLPAVTLNVVAVCFCSAILSGLRAMGAASRSLRAQLTASAAYVAGGSIGAVSGGALGSCWGVTLANAAAAVVWWYHLRAALRDHHQAAPHDHHPAHGGLGVAR